MKYVIKSEEAWKNALNLVAYFEGLRLSVYRCPAGFSTIGYGHRFNAGEPRTIDKATAIDYLVRDFGTCVDFLADIFPYLWEGQLFALASLSFNLGFSWISKDKNLGREVIALNKSQSHGGSNPKLQYNVCWYLTKYCYYKDTKTGRAVLSEGLRKRRLAERDLFNGELHFKSKK